MCGGSELPGRTAKVAFAPRWRKLQPYSGSVCRAFFRSLLFGLIGNIKNTLPNIKTRRVISPIHFTRSD